MNQNKRYLDRQTIEHKLYDKHPINVSVILVMIVLIITLSIVTFGQSPI